MGVPRIMKESNIILFFVCMCRVFVAEKLVPKQILGLPDNVVRHLNVLRLRVGETLVLFNGDGCEYAARLLLLEKRQAQVEVLTQIPTHRESPLQITLIQAVSSGERMDFTLQKGVELGVNVFIPVLSERSVVRLSGERAAKRVERWQEIVVSACEQCGRNVIPSVQEIVPYARVLQQLPEADVKVLLSLNRAQGLRDLVEPQRIVLMAGPEGGWTVHEEEQAFAAGFQAISLGKRVLRTETAALAAVSAMQTLWGDFR